MPNWLSYIIKRMQHLSNSNKSTIEEQQKLYGGKMWSQVFLTQPYMTSERLHRLIMVPSLSFNGMLFDSCGTVKPLKYVPRRSVLPISRDFSLKYSSNIASLSTRYLDIIFWFHMVYIMPRSCYIGCWLYRYSLVFHQHNESIAILQRHVV